MDFSESSNRIFLKGLATFAVVLFVLSVVVSFAMAETTSVGIWKTIQEPTEDKGITSTAYVDNSSGDRFSLTINAVQRKKVCAVRLALIPLNFSKQYEGKLIVDNDTLFEGVVVSPGAMYGDVLIIGLGFDWTEILEKLKSGNNLIFSYESNGSAEDIMFSLKGSSRAINQMLEKQSEIAQKTSGASGTKP